MDDRAVERALNEAGQAATAALWRSVCTSLEGPVTIALLALEDGPGWRAARDWEPRLPDGMRTTVLELGDADEPLPLSAEEGLLTAHAAVWVTPVQTPLGQQEREWLEVLQHLPSRLLWLGDVPLLAQLSDDPAAELAAIERRLAGQLDPAWERLAPAQLETWLAHLKSTRGELTRERKDAVARKLLSWAHDHLVQQQAQVQAERDSLDSLLEGEAEALEKAFVEGERIAARVRTAVEHHTSVMVAQLHSFARDLERALPGELEALESTDTARRVMPHWLEHVFAEFLADALGRCRRDVLLELEETGAADGSEVALAELLAPALSAHTVHVEGDWPRRLGVTAALGSGAAMLLAGLWIPGALAVSSGLVFGALAGDRDESIRQALLERSTDAVRRMAADAERQLTDQLDQLTHELEVTPDARRREVEERRQAQRKRLEQRREATARQQEIVGARLASLAEVLGS